MEVETYKEAERGLIVNYYTKRLGGQYLNENDSELLNRLNRQYSSLLDGFNKQLSDGSLEKRNPFMKIIESTIKSFYSSHKSNISGPISLGIGDSIIY